MTVKWPTIEPVAVDIETCKRRSEAQESRHYIWNEVEGAGSDNLYDQIKTSFKPVTSFLKIALQNFKSSSEKLFQALQH